jgi:hypothetical protein
MAASRIIEEETSTWSGRVTSTNGYCAGDFSDAPFRPLVLVAGPNPAMPTLRQTGRGRATRETQLQ